jgi:hypothetical protein
MIFLGNFVEEKDAQMKVLNEGNGYAGGISGWTIAGWSAVVLCMVILTCAIGYFKKSIE